MNVILEPETERWIVEEAKEAGTSPERYIAERLQTQREQALRFVSLSGEEAVLLARINEGFPDEFWMRYHFLISRRDMGVLTEDERSELIELSDRVEAKNAERVPYLIALARQRRVTLPELIQQLGLRPVQLNT